MTKTAKTAAKPEVAADIPDVTIGSEVDLYERKGAKPIKGTIEQINPDKTVCAVKIGVREDGPAYLHSRIVYAVAIADKPTEGGAYVLGRAI